MGILKKIADWWHEDGKIVREVKEMHAWGEAAKRDNLLRSNMAGSFENSDGLRLEVVNARLTYEAGGPGLIPFIQLRVAPVPCISTSAAVLVKLL